MNLENICNIYFYPQVIQTFVPCIFGEETSAHEILGIRITSFLMENFSEIFKVGANMNASALRCLNRLQYNIPHKMLRTVQFIRLQQHCASEVSRFDCNGFVSVLKSLFFQVPEGLKFEVEQQIAFRVGKRKKLHQV